MKALLGSALRLLLRDWRGGELGVLFSALILAVSLVVGISGFVNRLQINLERESSRFLAADLVVATADRTPESFINRAVESGLARGETVTFSSMVVSESDDMFLASVKAVGGAYPLRGSLEIENTNGQLTANQPNPGEVLLADRLVQQLKVLPGQRVWVGDAELVYAGKVISEPDGTSGFFGYGPRLMMNTADIEATGVIQPGSRVTFRLLLAGAPDQVSDFADWVRPQLVQGQRLLTVEESQPGIGATLDRARGFLLLAGSLGVMLAAAAILVAARRFGERHTDHVAVMKSLGATSTVIRNLYAASLGWLGVAAILIGSVLGWLAQSAMFIALAEQLPGEINEIGVSPYITGAVTALVCVGFFAWPPLARLGLVSPLRVLRRETTIAGSQRALDLVLGTLSLAGLMIWYSKDVFLTSALMGGIAVTVGLGFVGARALLSSSRQLGSRAGSVWRLALAGMQRRGVSSAFQIVIFGVAIMLLLVLVSVRTSLLDQWRLQLPEGTPNHYLLNVAPQEADLINDFFAEKNIEVGRLYPSTRGRVMAVNETPLPTWEVGQEGPRQQEANFTSGAVMPEGNVILDGEWWQPGTTESIVSLEEGFAQEIGATVGDVLTLRIAASEFEAQVASIREVDWESMQPNFFVIFPTDVLSRYPGMLLTSFYLEAGQKPVIGDLIDDFPTLTVIELDVVIDEIRAIVDQVSQAIELVLMIIMVAGALVLIAGVTASVDERLHESAILRALGAKRGRILGAIAIEFSMMGAIAGVLAAVGAELSGWLLQTQMLELDYQPGWILWPFGLVLGALVIGGLGTYTCRRVVSVPPIQVLREL